MLGVADGDDAWFNCDTVTGMQQERAWRVTSAVYLTGLDRHLHLHLDAVTTGMWPARRRQCHPTNGMKNVLHRMSWRGGGGHVPCAS